MSKAPHPKTPLRVVHADDAHPCADAGEAARAEARERYFRDPIAQADLLWERLAATAEDARTRRFWFRGPLATAWAWLRGEL